MRKQVLSLLALALISFSLEAQTTGGPDTYGYVWRNSADAQGPAFNWVEIDGLPETVEITGQLTDDNVSSAISLPAPFHYYWYDVNNFRVGSNGYITFAGNTNIASGANGFPAIPTPGAANNDFIAGMMTDLLFTGTPGRCYYYIAPTNDSLVVTYDSVPFWDNILGFVGANTFQIILNYSDSSIIINYLIQDGASASAAGAVSTGIENNSGTIGLQHLYNAYPEDTMAVKYYYPATTTLAISDASTTYNNNPDNGAIFLSRNGAPFYLNTEVKNTGNQQLVPFNVQSQIRSATNVLQISNTAQTDTLDPGESQVLNMANPFMPATAGAFFFRTDTQLPGDATPSNNRKDVEVQVIDTTLLTVELSYENANASTGTVGWSGGDGGSAVYMKPSFEPYTITAVKEFITTDANGVGYSMMVYDANGPNGTPGALLDSVFVAPGTFTLNAWTTTTLTAPVTVNAGGFYILWFMGGDGVALGTVTTAPISNRTYEVLGSSAPGNFAAYRERETEELMLRALIDGVVSVGEVEKGELFGYAYPNPSQDRVYLNYDLSTAAVKDFTMTIYNTNGQMVETRSIGNDKGQLEIDVRNMNAGLYLCKLVSGTSEIERRFTVIK